MCYRKFRATAEEHSTLSTSLYDWTAVASPPGKVRWQLQECAKRSTQKIYCQSQIAAVFEKILHSKSVLLPVVKASIFAATLARELCNNPFTFSLHQTNHHPLAINIEDLKTSDRRPPSATRCRFSLLGTMSEEKKSTEADMQENSWIEEPWLSRLPTKYHTVKRFCPNIRTRQSVFLILVSTIRKLHKLYERTFPNPISIDWSCSFREFESIC